MIDLQFPEPTGQRGVWFPIHWEPIPGSGERITVGIVATLGGETFVRQTLDAEVLRCLHGQSAAVRIVGEALSSLRAAPADWQSPITGFHRGHQRWAHAASLRDLVQIAVEDSSFIARPQPIEDEEDEADAVTGSDVWIKQIRERVVSARPDYAARFGRRFELKTGARQTRLDFVGQGLVANFVRVIPGTRLGYSVDRAKIKLADLSQARTHAADGLFDTQPREFELLIYRPPEDTPEHSDKAMKDLHSALSIIEDFADRHSLRMESFFSAEPAAQRVLKLAA